MKQIHQIYTISKQGKTAFDAAIAKEVAKAKSKKLEIEINAAKAHLTPSPFGGTRENYTAQIITFTIVKEEKTYTKKDMLQFAFECVGNFLSNSENQIEIPLLETIIDRNNAQFDKFEAKSNLK
jgi:hypothetical protein